MVRHALWATAALCGFLLADQRAAAQPSRQLPGVAPLMKMAPQQPPGGAGAGQIPNQRRRHAASQVGFETTDFYPKRGYPRFLGDAVEAGDVGGAGGAA